MKKYLSKSFPKLVMILCGIYVERPYDAGTVGVLQRLIQWGVNNGQLCLDESTISMGLFMMVSARGLIDNWYTRKEIFNLRSEMQGFVTKFIRLFYTGDCIEGADLIP